MAIRYENEDILSDWELLKNGIEIDGISKSSSSLSDSHAAVQQSLKVYADLMADRIKEDNLQAIDKDNIAGLIYNILMRDKTYDELNEIIEKENKREPVIKIEEELFKV